MFINSFIIMWLYDYLEIHSQTPTHISTYEYIAVHTTHIYVYLYDMI